MYKEISTEERRKSSVPKTVIITLSFAAVFLTGLYIGNGTINFGNGLRIGQNKSNEKLPKNLDFSSAQALYEVLYKTFDGDLNEDKLMDGVKKGLAEATGDQYTEFMNGDEAKEFSNSLNGTFSGIGAELSKEDDAIVIVSPISGYPAEKAGLRPKDVIIKINDENALDLSINEAVTKIRGPEGTKVKIKIIRDKKQELDFEITREKISIPSVEYSIENEIGYIKMSRFGDDTADLTKKAAQEFKAKNVKGVILDVRGNPGGLLDAAVDVSSLWLAKGKTVLEEKRGGEVIKTYTAKGGDILNGIPTVVLIDEGSASASEITAGALEDNKVATLIGVKSFGKGSVQQVVDLDNGGVLKVTIARWYTPAGKNIDKEGIQPNKEVKRTEDDYKNKKDPQKDAAIEFLNK